MENIKSPEDHVEAVLVRVEKRYIAATYGVADWTSHEDFLEQIAYKSGRLLKVNSYCLQLSLTMVSVVTVVNIRELHEDVLSQLVAKNCMVSRREETVKTEEMN